MLEQPSAAPEGYNTVSPGLSPKSTSASSPGRRVWRMNTSADPRPAGHTDDVAASTVRQPTPYSACNACPDTPARTSRRIAAYSSTFD